MGLDDCTGDKQCSGKRGVWISEQLAPVANRVDSRALEKKCLPLKLKRSSSFSGMGRFLVIANDGST